MNLAGKTLLAASLLSFGCQGQSAPPPASPAAAASPSATPAAAGPSPSPESSAPATAAATPSATTAPADDLVGKPAPDFTATTQTGQTFHLAASKGKAVVVYFYPKDETPGCTKEACSFRDAWEAIAKTGAVLVGISADSADSHRAFVEHYKLPFQLVTDKDG